MRERKNKDKAVLVYKFHARPVGQLPDEFWRVAKAMRDLWNHFVDMREAEMERLKDETDKAVKTEAWKQFDKALAEYQRSEEMKAQLHWSCREMILDRFKDATLQVAKALKEWRSKKASNPAYAAPAPTVRKRFGLDSVLLRHRRTDGGKPASAVLKSPSCSKAFSLKEILPDTYLNNDAHSKQMRVSRGIFTVGDSEFAFVVNMHRQVPPDANVKSVAWSGKRIRGLGWQWYLIVTVEQEPMKLHSAKQTAVAGLDLGWRKIDDDLLRIGVIYDSTGNAYELELPLGINKDVDHSIELGIWQSQEIDEKKDAIKANLIQAGVSAARVQKMGQAGLHRLLREFKEGEHTIAQNVVDELQQWADNNEALLGKKNRLNQHFERRRRWLYENIAHELCRRYKTIVIEGDLSLKDLAANKPKGEEKSGNDYAIEAAKRYMRAASLYQFKEILIRTAAKYETEIVKGKMAYSSVMCSRLVAANTLCCSRAEGGSKLKLTCEKGHTFDQDENAARLLLKQIAELPTVRKAPVQWLQQLPPYWQVIRHLE